MKKDMAAGALLLCLCAGYALATRAIPVSSLSDGVGPEGLPNLLAIALAVVALGLIGKSALAFRLARPAPAPAAEADTDERAGLGRALAFSGLGVLYMIVAPWLGFALAIAFIVLATAAFEGAQLSWRLAGVGALTGLGFWLVFVWFLGVEQPASRFFG